MLKTATLLHLVAKYECARDSLRLLDASCDFRDARGDAIDNFLREPMSDVISIRDACGFLHRVEQHNDDWLVADNALHHETTSRLANVSCFRQTDVPFFACDQPV